MPTKGQKIRLGAFVIATAALVVLVAVVFGGLRLWEGRDRYYVEFEGSVLGLEEGAEVTFGGIKVGNVDAIALARGAPGTIRVAIEVDEDLPIKADTTAVLAMAGVTGLRVIDLRGGSADAPRLAPGATIAKGETTLDKLERRAQQIVEDSSSIMTKANQVLDNLVEITGPQQYASLGETFEHARVASANLAGASEELRLMVRENRVALRGSLEAVQATATSASTLLDQQVPRLVTDAGALVDELRGVVRQNGTQLGSAMYDLRQASRSFKELARELRQRPSRLLRSDAPSERRLP